MKRLEQRAREYTAKIFNGATPSEVVKAYIVGATEETRELKRELEEERFVTADLKQQIEKMKMHANCNHCDSEGYCEVRKTYLMDLSYNGCDKWELED